jgi:hypothetical protein
MKNTLYLGLFGGILLLSCLEARNESGLQADNPFYSKPREMAFSENAGTHLELADINGDGKADRIFWNPDLFDGHTRIQLATGYGYFSETNLSTEFSQSTATKLRFADINGDGMDDRIYWLYSSFDGKTRIRLSQGDSFSEETILSTLFSAHSDTRLAFADVDGDGKADRVYWNPGHNDGNVRLVLGDGSGLFSSTTNDTPFSTVSSTRMRLADVNGDDLDDLLYWRPNYSNGDVRVQLASGDGDFGTNWIYSAFSASEDTKIFLDDITGDGRLMLSTGTGKRLTVTYIA